jgi:hypothetical protein
MPAVLQWAHEARANGRSLARKIVNPCGVPMFVRSTAAAKLRIGNQLVCAVHTPKIRVGDAVKRRSLDR